jgi:hypothetical protein
MTRGKLMLLIVVGFGLVWIALLVMAGRHVVTMSDLANREVAPRLPKVRTHVETAPAPIQPPYPSEAVAQALPKQWQAEGAAPDYPKKIRAEAPTKGQNED